MSMYFFCMSTHFLGFFYGRTMCSNFVFMGTQCLSILLYGYTLSSDYFIFSQCLAILFV